MLFKEAYRVMKEGSKIRRQGWRGYWEWKGDTILIHCWNGEVLDIRSTGSIAGTIENIIADDWVIVSKESESIENNKTLFDKELKINVNTVDDLKDSFIKICSTNGGVALWALDSLEYEFYQRIDEAKEKDAQISFINALRALHGEKQTKF